MIIEVFVSNDHLIAMANDVFARFERRVMEMRCDRLDELSDKMTARYTPFVENHPKSECFASLMRDELECYCAEAQVTILQDQERLNYLRQWRKKLHDLFLDQLRKCGEERLALELEPELEAEQAALTIARNGFVAFGLRVMELVVQMELLYRKGDEDDEPQVRSLAAEVMRTVRLERPNAAAYAP
jgi:hypothetical protein